MKLKTPWVIRNYTCIDTQENHNETQNSLGDNKIFYLYNTQCCGAGAVQSRDFLAGAGKMVQQSKKNGEKLQKDQKYVPYAYYSSFH